MCALHLKQMGYLNWRSCAKTIGMPPREPEKGIGSVGICRTPQGPRWPRPWRHNLSCGSRRRSRGDDHARREQHATSVVTATATPTFAVAFTAAAATILATTTATPSGNDLGDSVHGGNDLGRRIYRHGRGEMRTPLLRTPPPNCAHRLLKMRTPYRTLHTCSARRVQYGVHNSRILTTP